MRSSASRLGLLLLWLGCWLAAQPCLQAQPSFWQPDSSLNRGRLRPIVLGTAAGVTGLYAGLATVWYADQPRGPWRWFNDGAEWQQLDKVGHAYWAYQESRMMMDLLHWAGLARTPRVILGGLTGFVLQSPIEILDGSVSTYGASSWDLVANASGSSLAILNELLWREQRLQPKFSFWPSPYARQNTELLGSGLSQVIKDYNGQTYWISTPISAYFHHKPRWLPAWLSLSAGYGGSGMVGGYGELPRAVIDAREYRRWLLSVDVDWTRIPTRSGLLRTVLYLMNMLKTPAPALGLEKGKIVGYGLYY